MAGSGKAENTLVKGSEKALRAPAERARLARSIWERCGLSCCCGRWLFCFGNLAGCFQNGRIHFVFLDNCLWAFVAESSEHARGNPQTNPAVFIFKEYASGNKVYFEFPLGYSMRVGNLSSKTGLFSRKFTFACHPDRFRKKRWRVKC